MILSGTSAKLELITASATTIGVVASYVDYTSTTTTPINDNTVILSATTTTIVGSPSASTQRHIKSLSARNYHATDSSLVTFSHTDGTAATYPYATVLLAGESIYYSPEGGWKKYNAAGEQIVIGASQTPILNNKFVISGALYETFDRNLCDEVNTSVLSSGRLSGQAIYLPAGLLVSSISFFSGTTAAGTPTNQLFGLLDASRNLLQSSVNDTTTAWAANSIKKLSLASTFTTTYSGLYYLGIMVTATTVPTLKGNTAKTGGQLQAAAPSMGGTSNTGLTTALPATANAFGTVTTSFWGCVS